MKNYNIINHFVLGLIMLFTCQLRAQDVSPTQVNDPNPRFELGKGLNFKFNNGDYQFSIGGMIQPSIVYKKDSSSEPNYFFNSKRTFFNIAGKAMKEKISFLVQTDFSLTSPLLDAWIAYSPNPHLKITMGQQLTFSNNKEMTILESQLQYIERSLLSTQYSSSGREFGLYIESNLNLGNMLLVPQVAVTSGDGRNSFGVNSSDYDIGGLKYAGRMDLYPFGNFEVGNDKLVADIKGESKPKLALGAAGSYNFGASQVTGEGHGDFLLYDVNGYEKLPDYRKLYYDVLFKYKGFSVLGEYVVATGKVENGTYMDRLAMDELVPTQISELLALGSGFNSQLGYVINHKYGIDFRYAQVTPEFTSNFNSVVKEREELTLGLTKYVSENNIKLNASVSRFNTGSTVSFVGAFFVQLIF